MADLPPSVDEGGGGETRPGIRLQWPASDRPFDVELEKDLLESRLEMKIGEEDSVKKISFSDDKIQAYVELENESDIDKVLSSSLNLRKGQPPLVMERFDLLEVWRPYLIVKGLEEWMIEDVDMIKDHFQAEANGAQIQSIDVHGSETIIMFASPQVALRFGSSTELLGIVIQLEVGYTSSAPKVEKEVLAVRGLPRTKIPVEKMENALLKYFSRHSKLEATECRIVKGVGYLTFEDPKAVKLILSNSPTASFIAGSALQLSAIPISQMKNSAADDNSGVSASPPLRSDSTTSCGSLFSPSSSSSSMHMKAGFSRELSRDSFDSVSSSENQPIFICDVSDPEDSLRVQASSTSDRQHSFGRPPSSQPIQVSSTAPQQRQIQNAISTLPPVPENPPKFGVSPIKSDEHMAVQDIDTSYDHTKEVQLEFKSHPTRVHIDDVPPHKRDRSLIELYMKSLAFTECTVKQYGKSFMATFQQPIDFQKLKEKSRKQHLDSYVLSLYALDSTKQILVSGLGTTIPPYFVKTHFELYSGKESVDDVKTLPSDRAVVTFKDSKSVDVIMSEPKCMQLGDTSISITEYYDFMSYDEEDCSDVSPSMAASHSQQQVIPPPQQPPKYKWGPVVEVVGKMKAAWLESTLTTLNNALKPIQAEGSMEADSSGTPWLKVEPLDGSEEMSDWQKQVKDVLNEHFSDYREEAIPLPDYCQADIMKSTELLDDVTVTSAGSSLIIGGGSASVQETILKTKDMISDFEVSTEEKTYPRKHINYLKKFCKHVLDSIPDYTLDPDLKVIVVSGNKKVRECFWSKVQSEISNIQEKSITVQHEHFKLLSSSRGKERIEEMIGMKAIMFELESNPPDYTLCFLSPPHVDKETLKRIRDKFKTLLISGSFSISYEKLRLCSDKKWRELVEKIQKNNFVLVTVEDSSKTIIVTGEPIHMNDVIDKIENFLSEHTSVEERLNIDFHKWSVMKNNFKDELDKIKHAMGKRVKVTWPESKLQTSVYIVIRGDPNKVDDVKLKLEALQSEVCSKEEKLCNIPAAIKVVESMEDRIRVLEGQYGACIDVSLTCDDRSASSSQSSSVAPLKLCSATCPNEVRLSVYAGDFTKHNHVDSIITFIPPNPTYQEEIIKALFSAGGPPFQDDFKRKIGQFIHQSPGEIFKSFHGHLQCNELFHCFLHPWVNGSSNEEFYLEECLNKALHSTRRCNTILFTPSSLKYPADVFVKNIISSLCSNSSISSDMTVAVYVNDISQAQEFECQLKQNDCRIITPVSTQLTLPVNSSAHQVHQVARSISSPISSYITLLRGSLLEQQAEVYVNSTNSNLDLKTGTLSNILLKTCGDELQKKCSEYAPLKTGDVAVTEAKNLKCDFIYHVALPDFKSDHNASRKFRTTVQMILRTAKEKGAKSLAIPSLGVGNLNYPAQVSAKILFEEIITFHARNPGSDVKYYLVVYEKNIHQEFSKEYAQKMNSAPPPRKSLIKSKKSGGSTKLSVEKSDISDEDVDIVVNTTTENMKLDENAVSKAVLKKAGPMLQSACDQLVSSGLKLDHGEIVTTKSYGSLQCKKIIHAHLPPLSATSKAGIDHFSLIVDIVKKCLAKAESEGMESISFPAFGFGQGGYSVSQVATPMLTAFRDFGRSNPKSVRTIRIVIFDSALHKEFLDFFVNFFKVDMAAPRKLIHNLTSKLSKSGSSDNSVELQDGVDATTTAVAPPRRYDEPISNPLVSFKIYASSDGKCDEIASQLKQVIKDNCKTEEINDPIIANLIDDDIADIKGIGSQHQVQVNVMAAINQIQVLGEKSDVALAVKDITIIITDIKKAESELKSYQWQTESDSEIEPYSDANGFKLERAHMKKLSALEMIIDGIELVIDLDRMEERSKETGDVRKVARVPKNPNIKLPDTWEPQPQEAGGKPETMHMFEVASGSAEFQEALKRFHDTIGSTTVQVVKLERIQNPNEYRRHSTLFETISRKHHNKKIEVKQLFHGCKEDSVKPIATQGFNRNFAADANAAYYGRGVYFALNSSYSAHPNYSKPNKDGHQFMFISRVIIGEYTVGNKTMKVAPALQEGSLEVFDTLVEKKDNPTIFVAMTDAQAYPEYLITFKINKGKS